MKLASLFSGGKDSTYAIYLAKKRGFSIECLITLYPSNEESLLFHFPNTGVPKLQAQAMNIPIIEGNIPINNLDDEIKSLDHLVKIAKAEYKIEGLINGGLFSNFQKNIFNNISKDNDLVLYSPLWGADQFSYMKELLIHKFFILIVGVSAMGLDEAWLGTIIDQDKLEKLFLLSKKYGFNVAFEGGEAETLVIDCPIYEKRLQILNSTTKWDGQRGIIEITDIVLMDK